MASRARWKRLLFALCWLPLLAGCHGNGAPAGSSPFVPAVASHTGSLLVVDPKKVGATVSDLILGANEGTWENLDLPSLVPRFRTTGLRATRWPGGSEADNYHWKTNSIGVGKCSAGYASPSAAFDNFMTAFVKPAKLDVAITVNYGSNPKCTNGADPAEAAGWVHYANDVKGYNITWWTVGNEEYGRGYETDRHQPPTTEHNPTYYANLVATEFYPKMKAASKIPIDVCVVVEGGSYYYWDPPVIHNAKYDCVELHYYPQAPGNESDSFIVNQGAPLLSVTIAALRRELAAAGHPNTPIYLGEMGSVYAKPGKQSMSITQALFAGQTIGEMATDGIPRATWWFGESNCEVDGNLFAGLYGWQAFGGYEIFENGRDTYTCSAKHAPRNGTPNPTARAFETASHFIRNGEHMLGLTLRGLTGVRAYASTYGGGYAVMLFNLDENATRTVPVKIAGRSSGSGGSVWTYDKSIYDRTKYGSWQGPAATKLAPWSGTLRISLPPWSMVVVQVR